MKEFSGNLNSADTTCWIDCECGQEDIFVSDSLVRCPKCGRGYKVNFTVSQFEKNEEDTPETQAKSTIEMLLAKALWPEINLETLNIYLVPPGMWAVYYRSDYPDIQVITEHIPLHPFKILTRMNYEPKINTLFMSETEIVKGDL